MSSLPRTDAYPETGAARSDWIRRLRGRKEAADPSRTQAALIEEERAESGGRVEVATLFLTNRECPWRCLMCDLWRHTTDKPVAAGAVPRQIGQALRGLPKARQIKLYNSGSFFDPGAIPPQDFAEIARLVAGFERVIVECHPGLVGPACLRFRDLLAGRLEVAMGLETVHPSALERLNKRMSLGQFAQAAQFLSRGKIGLRVFALIHPPFVEQIEAASWARRTIEFAMEHGATAVSLIPTRLGNGALDELAKQGLFREPTLAELEAAHDFGVGLGRSRVFADLWDLERFSRCPVCFEARRERLRGMNFSQSVAARVVCACGS